jgi:hypothetical protein
MTQTTQPHLHVCHNVRYLTLLAGDAGKHRQNHTDRMSQALLMFLPLSAAGVPQVKQAGTGRNTGAVTAVATTHVTAAETGTAK